MKPMSAKGPAVVALFYLMIVASSSMLPTPPGVSALESSDKIIYWNGEVAVASLPAGFQVATPKGSWRVVGPQAVSACSDGDHVWVAAWAGGLSYLYVFRDDGASVYTAPGEVASLSCGPGWSLLGVVRGREFDLVYFEDGSAFLYAGVASLDSTVRSVSPVTSVYGLKAAWAGDIVVVLNGNNVTAYHVHGAVVRGVWLVDDFTLVYGSYGEDGLIIIMSGSRPISLSYPGADASVHAVYASLPGRLLALLIPEGRLPLIVEVSLASGEILASYRFYPSTPMIYNGASVGADGIYLYITLVDEAYAALRIYRPAYTLIPGGSYSLGLIAPVKGVTATTASGLSVSINKTEVSRGRELGETQPPLLPPLPIEADERVPSTSRLQAIFTALVLLAPPAALLAAALRASSEGAFGGVRC